MKRARHRKKKSSAAYHSTRIGVLFGGLADMNDHIHQHWRVVWVVTFTARRGPYVVEGSEAERALERWWPS